MFLKKKNCYKFVKFTKLTVLNLAKLGLCEAGSTIENIVKGLYGMYGNMEFCYINLYPITKILKVLDLGNLPLQVGIVDLWVK